MPKIVEIEIGKKYKDWTVLEQTDKQSSNGCSVYKCECKCGKIRFLRTGCLNSKRSNFMCRSCSKKTTHASRPDVYADFVGKKFGRWTIVKQLEKTTDDEGYRSIFFECICACGVIANVRGAALKRGGSTCCTDCAVYKLRCKCGCFNHKSNAFKIDVSECELIGFCPRCDKFCCMICSIDPATECGKKEKP